MDPHAIADRFGLGQPVAEPVVSAVGGEREIAVRRLETTSGVFAVKDVIADLLPDDVDEAFRIERAAHDAGVPSPPPVPSATGACFEQLDGRWYRCHEWIGGTAKQNEDTTPDDAYAMGTVVATLHGLEIPARPTLPTHRFGQDHWLELARRRPDSSWARTIDQHIDGIDASETLGATFHDERTVGSHRDLNAHNVLFSDEGLWLVDWDVAGPASVVYERASTAALWAQRHDGSLDVDIATGFVRGYRDGGGTIEADDPVLLPLWLSGLSWWTERNVQIAIAEPSEHHDQLATGLVTALAQGVDPVHKRQAFLAAVIVEL